MLILCEYCDIRCICYDDWMEHLLSSRHQEVVREAINSWDSSLNQRSLLITISGTKPEKNDICWYFANYGLVCDAFFEADFEFCVIQLDKKDYAEAAFAAKHKFENAKMTVRRKADVSENEWLLLNCMVRRNATKDMAKRRIESFEERHTKLTEALKSFPLDYQMERFEREIKMNTVEISVRQKLVKDLNTMFGGDVIRYPKCILCPYGSLLTGLGSNSSLLNMYFDAIGQSANKENTSGSSPHWRQAFDILEIYINNRNRKELFCYDLIALPRDETPCIKFIHYTTGVKCRITFDFLPVRTSQLTSLVMKLDPRLPALFMFIKYWGAYHKLTGAELITPYSLNLLILVYLTQKKIIPSVSVLQSISTRSIKVNGWETSFCEETGKIINLMSFYGSNTNCEKNVALGKPTAATVLELAVDFYKLYAHADLQSLVICPATGELLSRSVFEVGNEDSLPNGLEAYKEWATGGSRKHSLNTKSLLCIQDPFNLKSNVSYKTPEEIVWKFQFTCADTVDNLETVLKSANPNLMEIFNPSSTSPSPTKHTVTETATTSSGINDEILLTINRERLHPMADDLSVITVPRRIQEYNYTESILDEQPPPIDTSVPPPNWNQHPRPTADIQSTSKYNYNHPQHLDIGNEPFMQPQYLSQYSPGLDPVSSPELYPQEFPPARIEPERTSSTYSKLTASGSHMPGSSSRSKSRFSRPVSPSTIPASKKLPRPVIDYGERELIYVYSPNDEFVQKFEENFGNLVLESALKIRLRVLWCIFLEDFFSEVWSDSFRFGIKEIHPESVPVKPSTSKLEVSGISHTSLIFEMDKPEPRLAKRQKTDDETETKKKYIYAAQRNPYKQNFFEIKLLLLLSKAYICSVKETFLKHRERSRRTAQSDSHLDHRFPNPIDWERKVSRMTEDRFKGRKPKVIGKFVTKIIVDSSKDKCVTVIFKYLHEDSKEMTYLKDVTDHIISVFRDLVPKYQMYRLNKWLDTNNLSK